MNTETNPVEKVHLWGNTLVARSAAVSEAEVREMWTEDGSIVVNGQVKCLGIGAVVRHFEELRARYRSARVQLPYAIAVASGPTISARYVIDVEYLDGARDKIQVGAFFSIENGKIKSMDEVAWFERSEISLEKH